MEDSYLNEKLWGDIDVDYSEYQSKSYSIEEVMVLMNQKVANVMSVIKCPNNVTRTLLDVYNWDIGKLCEKYFETDLLELFSSAEILYPQSQLPQISEESSSTVVCKICLVEYSKSDVCSLSCGHHFDKNCYRNYLTHCINNDRRGSIRCPAFKCFALFEDETVYKLLIDDMAKKKYKQMILNNYVQCNRLLRWCPTAGCGRVIEVEIVGLANPAKCNCGSEFCTLCSLEWHEPIPCDLVKLWNKKKFDDSETANWKATNTKPCPKCGVDIEKNGGCNHMTCRNFSCNAQFCWSCGSLDYKNHYECNRYDASNDLKKSVARITLERYLFFNQRYLDHLRSLTFEQSAKNSEKIKEQREILFRDRNFLLVDTEFLRKALLCLCQCRRTLMYTYVFSYYVKTCNQSTIFLDNQDNLQKAVENLAQILESDFWNTENLVKLRMEVQDLNSYLLQRRKVLVNHIREGYDKKWWEFDL